MGVPYYGDFAEDDTVIIRFNTFSSNDPSESVTVTTLVDADVKVYKDDGITEIATDGATVTIDFDSRTGAHIIKIDTSAHADYTTGSEYGVMIEGATVDGGNITGWVGCFSIERAGGALALTIALTATLGTPANIDTGGATIADNIKKIADDNGGLTFDAATDSLNKIRDDRTLAAADYVVVGDTIAGVTSVADVAGDVKGNVDGTVAGVTPEAAGVAAIKTKQDTMETTLNDVPTTAEFEARTIAAADYLVEGDTLARVTLVDTVTTNTDLVSAADIKTAMEADGGDLSSLMEALVNKRVWTEIDGNLEMFNDAGVSQGNIAAQVATDGTYTTAKRALI